MRDHRPPVSPSSYRGFLSGHDGGYQPYERHFSYRDEDGRHAVVINHFLGVAPVPEPGMNLVDAAGAGRTSPGVLPIASDAYGNHVCLDGREGRDGPVLFWGHRGESGLYPVACDLWRFINGLTKQPELPFPSSRPSRDWGSLLFWRR